MSAHPETILRMFREGMDTFAIAKELNLSEATVSRHLWVARCREKGLPARFLSRGVVKQIADQEAA
ncbi:MAG TPA: helix-turn-helix domain-containing protein [Clostridia bacterium]|nr:helix-turn-helix domain-containing protein [Clostridia bacterium]